jgi:hypothetical protein
VTVWEVKGMGYLKAEKQIIIQFAFCREVALSVSRIALPSPGGCLAGTSRLSDNPDNYKSAHRDNEEDGRRIHDGNTNAGNVCVPGYGSQP